MPVTDRDYASIILEQLDAHGRDFAGLTRLVSLFPELTDEHRDLMARGLVRVLGDRALLERPGVLADAVHLAYALRLFDERTARAVGGISPRSEMVATEIENYRVYGGEVAAESDSAQAAPTAPRTAVA